MTTINEADTIYLGDEVVDRVYAGTDLIWPGEPTGFSPTDLTGLTIWLDASQLGLANGAAVNPWPNLADVTKPGVMEPAASGTDAALQANVLNGKSVVRFYAGHKRLRINATGITTAWTLAYVGRMVSDPNRLIGAIYPTGGNLVVGYHGGLQDLMYDNGWTSPHVPTAWSTSWKLYSADGAPGLSRLFANGAFHSSTTTAAGFGGTFAISGYGATTAEETSTCEVAEVCFYNRKLSDVERVQVETYLQEKWLG
jgi:hypothetical protein